MKAHAAEGDSMSELQEFDISHEVWREYDYEGRVYRIDEPRTLYVGRTTHRVVDKEDVAHCCPAPGEHGCVVRWYNGLGENPVKF